MLKSLHKYLLFNDLKIRPETVKPLEENIGGILDISPGNDFLDMTPRVQATKAKIDR